MSPSSEAPTARQRTVEPPSVTERLAARRRTRRTRILIAAAAALCVLALVAAAWFSPVLAVRSVQTKSTGFYTAAQIEQAVLSDFRNTPLPQARPGPVAEAALARLPKAARVDVRWAGLHTLGVTVTDRVPLVAVRAGSGWERVDRTGVTIDTVAEPPQGLARLELTGPAAGRQRGATIPAVLTLLGALPQQAPAKIAVVRAGSPEKIELEYTAGRSGKTVTIRFGSPADAARKFATAEKLLPTGPKIIDVSVPEVPVTS